jgi:chemotaxis protein CheD
MVRMGEYAGSASHDDVLVAIGLGSCVGVALVDRRRGVAGLAHVMLPEAAASGTPTPGKSADLAVPALVELVESLGARRIRLDAVLVGGACMFSFGDGSGLDIGARNETAVREALAEQRIPVRAAATSGSSGRTMRLHVGDGRVTVRVAGGADQQLWGDEALATTHRGGRER